MNFDIIKKRVNKETPIYIGVLLVFVLMLTESCGNSTPYKTDVLVIGGGTAGTAAAISSGRMGVSTLLINPDPWLGGMLTAAGVSAVDGNTKLPSGFWGEFRDSLIGRYGDAEALKTGWVSNHLFEPEVGASIFLNISNSIPNLSLWHNTSWESISKKNEGWLISVSKENKTQLIWAKEIIDATELGDVSKAIGIPHYIGMDSQERFNEAIAPSIANDIIQDLTYVLILKEYDQPVVIEQPEGYDPSVFYCSTANEKCIPDKNMNRVLWPKQDMINYGKLPGQKYMINWPINGNDFYLNAIDMTTEERKIAFEAAKLKSLQFLYYLQTELGFDHLGIDYDQFPTGDGFPLMPYHRESRRIVGEVTLTINDIAAPYGQEKKLYRSGIAVGDYPVDHHHAAHPLANELPELHFYPVPSYSIPMGSLLPQDIDHFIVTEKSISVSNLVNGTTRLQPVVLQLGQVAGLIAANAVIENITPKQVSIRKVQGQLLSQGGYLLPYLDVPKTHPHFKVYQRIGATGILRGTGKNVGWENQTWFYPDQTLTAEDVYLTDWVREDAAVFPLRPTLNNIIEWLNNNPFKGVTIEDLSDGDTVKEILSLENLQDNDLITRGQFAILLDRVLNPFSREINFNGDWEDNL